MVSYWPGSEQVSRLKSETFARLGLLGGLIIGLPALMNYGSPELKAKVVPDILAGKKVSSRLTSYTLH